MSHKMAHKVEKSGHLTLLTRVLIAVGALVVVAGAAVVALLILAKPTVSVADGGQSLFNLDVGGLGTDLTSVVVSSGGAPLAVERASDGYVPTAKLAQGQAVEVTATVKSPSWLSWLVGGGSSTVHVLHTPAASPSTEVAVASSAGQVQVSFDGPVSVVSYRVGNGKAETVDLTEPSQVASLPVPKAPAGSLSVSASPRAWENTSSVSTKLTWFAPPSGAAPAALVSPSPGSDTATANSAISITFADPVSQVLGSTRPKLSPAVPGAWSQPDADTLVFTPSGFGFGPGEPVTVTFDRSVSPVGSDSTATTTDSVTSTRSFTFSTATGSITRLEQILADLHYLPLDFVPAAGATEPNTLAAQIAAIDDPVAGSFQWRWPSTPAGLQSSWSVGSPNLVVKGALMAFESTQPGYDGYLYPDESVGQIVTPSLWQSLIQADLSGTTDPYPYAYVYVTKALPETLTLWENGQVVLTSRANTGIPVDPTADGTFPVYIRFKQNWMNGTNPDGSTYHDMVYWISYFNGGDAVHAFPRSSYGFPQSLGCVELPYAAGETAFNDMAIGDLVTVAG